MLSLPSETLCTWEEYKPPLSETNGGPTLAEMVRRLTVVETRLDARTLNVDVYQAEKAAFQIQIQASERRLHELESRNQALQRMLMGAFLGFVADSVGLLIVYAIMRTH